MSRQNKISYSNEDTTIRSAFSRLLFLRFFFELATSKTPRSIYRDACLQFWNSRETFCQPLRSDRAVSVTISSNQRAEHRNSCRTKIALVDLQLRLPSSRRSRSHFDRNRNFSRCLTESSMCQVYSVNFGLCVHLHKYPVGPETWSQLSTFSEVGYIWYILVPRTRVSKSRFVNGIIVHEIVCFVVKLRNWKVEIANLSTFQLAIPP